MGLILKNVSKTFTGKKVVDNISFSLEEPGVFGLLGTNMVLERQQQLECY